MRLSATLVYSKGTAQAKIACANPPTRYVHSLCKVFGIGWHNYILGFAKSDYIPIYKKIGDKIIRRVEK